MKTIRAIQRRVATIGIIASVYLSGLAMADTIPLMTKEALKSRLLDTDISILDVRSGKDWTSSEFKISGAIRVKPSTGNEWVDNFDKSRTYVIYCA